MTTKGAGPGFLERGFMCINVCACVCGGGGGGGSLCLFYLTFIKYASLTKLFHFHRIFNK